MKYEKIEIKRLKSEFGQKIVIFFFQTRVLALEEVKNLSKYKENMCERELLKLD